MIALTLKVKAKPTVSLSHSLFPSPYDLRLWRRQSVFLPDEVTPKLIAFFFALQGRDMWFLSHSLEQSNTFKRFANSLQFFDQLRELFIVHANILHPRNSDALGFQESARFSEGLAA